MAVGLGGEVAEALHHIYAHLFGLSNLRVGLQGRQQLVLQLLAVVLYRQVPRHVVDAGADYVYVLLLIAQRARYQVMAALHAVAQAHGGHAAVLVAVPGHHGVGVGVVEHHAAGRGHLAYVAAEVLKRRYVALRVHYAARAERVAHALVHAVPERYLYVLGKALQHAYAHAVDHVLGAAEGLAPVERGLYLYVQAVGLYVALAQLVHHVQVVRIDIGKRNLYVAQLGHGKYVREQLARKAY